MSGDAADHLHMDGIDGVAVGPPPSSELVRDLALRACARLAARTHLDALRREPRLTAAMGSAATEVAASGIPCRLDGLDQCVKSTSSLLRKARDDSLELGCDPGTAITRIRDAIRYTVVMPTERFAEGVEAFRAALGAQGVHVAASFNKFCPGNRYMGVHDEAVADGQHFEIQFHTEESLAAKAWSRQRFEVVRDPAAPAAERLRAYDECVLHNRDAVPIPDGVERLGAPRRTQRPAPLP